MSKLKGALCSGRSGALITTEHQNPLYWDHGYGTYGRAEPVGKLVWSSFLDHHHILKKNVCPVVSFSMKVRSLPPDQTILAHEPGIIDLSLKTEMDCFALSLDSSVPVRFLIEVRFLDLKIADQTDRDPVSIWPSVRIHPSPQQDACSKRVSVLQENNDYTTDITISTSDGSIRAHSSVLAARSPVFQSMFSHNLKEKQLSAVDISDMSCDECQTFINYMYGDLQEQEFIAHRLALIGAVDKYDISELKSACHDSLLLDVDTENLLERIQAAHLYQLVELKRRCVRLLVDFAKLYEIHDDFIEFITTTDKDLVAEIMREVLSRFPGVV